MPGVIDARDRDAALRALAAGPLDVLVIGGGITGAGAALDAASRGLRVGLIESRDLAAGTSSRSSKLIHGGLRYLEQGDFKLVKEALRERDLLEASWRRTWCGRSRSSTRCTRRWWSAPMSARALRSTTPWRAPGDPSPTTGT
jgi:glycerol-3-phosphate dehydrogenase